MSEMGRQAPVRLDLMEGYSRWAKSYDSTFNTLIATEEVYSLDLLDSLEGVTALDAGAGTGRFALRLGRRGWKVTAIEPNPEMRAIAERAAASENLPIEFVNSSLEDDVPVKSAAFDLVVCALTLCHVANLGGAVASSTAQWRLELICSSPTYIPTLFPLACRRSSSRTA